MTHPIEVWLPRFILRKRFLGFFSLFGLLCSVAVFGLAVLR